MRTRLIIATLLLAPSIVFAQGISQLNPWKTVNSAYITPLSATVGLLIPGLATSTSGALCVSSSGWVSPVGCTAVADGTFSTTSANFWSSLGLSFSTTSADYWETQQAARGADGTFSTTSANYWSTFGLGFSTTSTDYWKTQRIIGNVSTATAETAGRIAFWSTTAGSPATLNSIATTTQAFSGPFTVSAAQGFLVGGSNSTITWTGLATTSQPSSSNLLVSNGAAGVYGIATSAPSVTSPITYSGTLGAFVGGVAGSFGCTTAANGTAGCITGANHTLFSSSRVATGQPETKGQIAFWTTTAGAPATLGSAATGTISGSGGITVTANQYVIGSGLTVTCTGASASAAGCLSTADWSSFNGRLSTTTLQVAAGQGLAFSTTTSNFWAAAGLGFSSTSQSYWNSQSRDWSVSLGGLTPTTTIGIVVNASSSINLLNVVGTASTSRLRIPFSSSIYWDAITLSNGTFKFSTSTSAYSAVWSVATSGSMSFGPNSIAPFARGFFWFVDTDGTRPCIGLGGNDGGDSDWLMCRTANNNATNDDMFGIGPTTASTTEPTSYNIRLRPGGTTGIGSSTPSVLWGNIMGTTTLVSNAQFVVAIASSTANLPTVIVPWNGSSTSAAGNHYRYLLQQNTTFVINATTSNPVDGGKYTLELCQDNTGSRTATFATPVNLRWRDDATTTITSTANKCSYIFFSYENQIYHALGSSTNQRLY